jgi:alanine racemase
MSDRLTVADINLGDYAQNISKILGIVPKDTKVMAVVKANAYGHGIEVMAKTAVEAGAAYIGVVSLGELKKVRNAGVQAPILLLNYIDKASVMEAIKLDASITVMDEKILSAIEKAASSQVKKAKVHIKIDTGMHRAGCDPDKLLSLAQAILSTQHLELEGLFTHLAEAEDLDVAFTHQQLKTFEDAVDVLRNAGINPPLLHCANSAAIINFPEAHFTMVRPGLITYGLNPFPEGHQQHEFVAKEFKPVLSLKTQVIFVRTIESGETVGYNRRWQAERQSVIALLPVGYGDGYRRAPHNATRVLINGQYAPIVGSVAMDQTAIDVTDIDGSVVVGDEAILLGKQNSLSITADEVATAYGTISYEVITSLSDRIDRSYSY